jgi:hypothetical protein
VPDPAAAEPNKLNAPAAKATSKPMSACEEQALEDHGGRMTLMLTLLGRCPGEPQHARDVAHSLGITNINSFRVQMSQWAHRGLIHKTGPATYTLAC